MMKKSLATLFLLCTLPMWLIAQDSKPGAPSAPLPTPSSSQTLRVRVELVNVLMTVTDKKNRLVVDMTKDDFHVYEDGRSQMVQYFSRESDLPLRIAILIDTSNSIRDRLRFEQEAAIDFLTTTIRRGKDMAFVVGFDVEPQLVQDYTDDIERLGNAIHGLQAGGVTSLYDAIFFSAKEKMLFFPPPEPYLRRVMIIISDGQDNQSEHTREEALAMAQRGEVTLFTISTNRSGAEIRGDKVLRYLADQTGGRAFFPFEASELAANFQEIARELRSQYSLAYVSTNPARDGSFRKIVIQPLDKSLHVQSKAGYFAPTQ
jgi:Ca-activated chloride channel homolog